MSAYEKGQTVKLGAAFTDAAGAAANPTTVACKVEKPDKTETTYTSISTPAVTNPSTGTFQVIITADQSGMWSWRWEGLTATTAAIDEGQFTVVGSAFA